MARRARLLVGGRGRVLERVAAECDTSVGMTRRRLAFAALGVIALAYPPITRSLLALVGVGDAAQGPGVGPILLGVAANTVAWIGYGLALWLLAIGTLPAGTLSSAAAIAGFAASYIAGLVALLAPGGLLVREGVMIAMLQGSIGIGPATGLAIADGLKADVNAQNNLGETALHGTAYFKMLDDAAFYAANSLETDRFLLTTAFNLLFTRPLKDGPIIAEGRWVSGRRRVFVAEARLTDANGDEAARGTGTFMRSAFALSTLAGYSQAFP